MNAAIKGHKSGTHRLVSPAETLARVRPLLPKMGITRIANVTGLDTIGIPVMVACRPNSRSIAVSQGKGLDLDAARASAVMESIEGYHAERILQPLKLASLDELSVGHLVADVGQLPLTETSAFHANLPILWIQGDDWLAREKIWVPYQIVHTAYTPRLAFDLNSFVASSSGLASGNHPLEAASHAICELVERGAQLRFSCIAEDEQDTVYRIDLDTVDDADCREALRRYEHAKVAVAVWDMTSEIGIAAFQCAIVDRDEDPLRRLYAAEGFGCHPVRHIALLRALTEAAQSRLTAISGSRDDLSRQQYLRWQDPAVLLNHRRRASMKCARRFSDVPSFASDSFEDDVAWELQQVRRAGYERVIVIDLSRPEIGLPVVRVIIPGMETLR